MYSPDVTDIYQCGGLITGAGVLTSPSYPFYYGQNIHCHWEVSLPEGFYIQIDVLDIDLAVSPTTNALLMVGFAFTHPYCLYYICFSMHVEDNKISNIQYLYVPSGNQTDTRNMIINESTCTWTITLANSFQQQC